MVDKNKVGAKPATTPTEALEVLSLLTLNQATFLQKNIMDSSERTGFARTEGEGALVASLRKLGLIQPFGRIGQKVRWQPVMKLFTLENRRFLKLLVGEEHL